MAGRIEQAGGTVDQATAQADPEPGRSHDAMLAGAIISGSAAATIVVARALAFAREGRTPARPFHRALPNLKALRRTGDRGHRHHFLAGISIGFLSGASALVSDQLRLHPAVAGLFGTGLGLTLDEIALLWELRDRYWADETVVVAEVGLLGLACLGLIVARRRRASARDASAGGERLP